MDHNQQSTGRRGHFHRPRRGPDRRGGNDRDRERRGAPQNGDQPQRNDQTDVEQLMRDIRSRIAQRHGIELSREQVQDLAARRLDAILDPGGINPKLLEQFRRGAATPAAELGPKLAAPAPFNQDALFQSDSGVVRFFRKLFRPLLSLLFDPAPVGRALDAQGALIVQVAARNADHERRQAEWNALHFELLRRIVTENARLTIENESLSLRIESLAGKVDFNERRVRHLEGTAQTTRPRQQAQPPAPVQPRSAENSLALAIAPSSTAVTGDQPAAAVPQEAGDSANSTGDAQRRRRRRRRGRRGTGAPGDVSRPIGRGETNGGADIEADGDGDEFADDTAAPVDAAEAQQPSPAPDDASPAYEPSPAPVNLVPAQEPSQAPVEQPQAAARTSQPQFHYISRPSEPASEPAVSEQPPPPAAASDEPQNS